MLQITIRGLYQTKPTSFENLVEMNPELEIEKLARLLDEKLKRGTVHTRLVSGIMHYLLAPSLGGDEGSVVAISDSLSTLTFDDFLSRT